MWADRMRETQCAAALAPLACREARETHNWAAEVQGLRHGPLPPWPLGERGVLGAARAAWGNTASLEPLGHAVQ